MPTGIALFALVLFLYRLQFRLDGLHLLHLAGLTYRQRDHRQANENREDDDAESEIEEQQLIQQREAVDHRPHDYFKPEDAKYLHLFGLPARGFVVQTGVGDQSHRPPSFRSTQPL